MSTLKSAVSLAIRSHENTRPPPLFSGLFMAGCMNSMMRKTSGPQTRRKGGYFGSWESQARCKRLITAILQVQRFPTPRINQSAPEECARKQRECRNEALINPTDLITLSIFAGDSHVELNSTAFQPQQVNKSTAFRLSLLIVTTQNTHLSDVKLDEREKTV